MPESRARKTKSTEPLKPTVIGGGEEEQDNPTWYKAVMFGLMLVGLVYILIFYISSARYPLGVAAPIDLGNWNILVGFGIAMIGFAMTTKWK
jgi:threonine/homoserine efflux transporter RhtA